jgi:hypothetical protein
MVVSAVKSGSSDGYVQREFDTFKILEWVEAIQFVLARLGG